MRTLVLGSAGQIGSALKNYLGKDAISYDIVDQYCRQDLRNPYNTALIPTLYRPDFVMFLAFDVGGSQYLKKYQDTYEFIDNNARIMVNTFRVLEEHKIPFIFASSQMSNMSYSPYGVLKALGEYYTKSLGGLVVKFWNVYGIENDPEKTHVITDLINHAIKYNVVDVKSSGMEQRQFLYADDCCEALATLADQYESLDKTKPYHITSFKWHSIRDVASIISQKNGGIPIHYSKEEDVVQKDIRNEPDPYILNFWKPRTSLEDGIGNIMEVYRARNLKSDN
jgi:nucleoside-diphosphate-sugar epimerase